MRLGLIVRSERDRGLGIQTKAMWDNLSPDKTLLVINKRSGFESHPEDYPGATHVYHTNRHGVWTLDEEIVRDWLSGLDVVLSVETLYDWRMVEWAREAHVKTIVHGNPEFWMATNPQPDVWWWPTTWRGHVVPYGPIVPVPVPDGISWMDSRQAFDDRPLKVSHVAGSGAMDDRNGSLIMHEAKRRLQDMEINIYDQKAAPVADRFDMYRDHQVLALPRRYGGLCLPVLEAMAHGLMVIMPNCSPNKDWSPVYHVDCEPGKVVTMQTGPVELHDVYPNIMMNTLKAIDKNRHLLNEYQTRSAEWAQRNTWQMLGEIYHREINRARSL